MAHFVPIGVSGTFGYALLKIGTCTMQLPEVVRNRLDIADSPLSDINIKAFATAPKCSQASSHPITA